MTTDKASSRDQSAFGARLAHLHEVGASMLARFGDHLVGDYDLTLVARNASFPGGSRDIVITESLGSSIVETVLERLPDTAGSEEQTGLFLADRLIAISAFRYALGRMSCMPSHVAYWLWNNRSRLSKPDRDLIVREIDEAAERKMLDMAWARLRDAMVSETTTAPSSASRSLTTFGPLHFENGRLAKVGMLRPEQMSGEEMIRLIRELAAIVEECR